MIGTSLGRFRLLERLGSGAVGTVYRAEDSRLGRDVAIKVLNDQSLADGTALARFRQEARALSRLLHPGIATVFDFDCHGGQDYLVMEYVGGETLERSLAYGPLPEARARAIAVQVADALDFAHEHGVVHRDLKPENVIITPKGHAKVLDFGLASLLADGSGTASARMTLAGTIVGTVRYMSPEQVAGGTVDGRADVYALGVMLYEMLSGRWPYQEGALAAMLFQVVHQPPAPLRDAQPKASEEIAAVVDRCLAKDPALRFATAGALARALRGDQGGRLSDGWRAADGPGRAAAPRTADPSPRAAFSVAVLPLQNRSGDVDQEFFADGMTDALIADLAQTGVLRVISRTSSMRFKDTTKPIAAIAEELKVDAIVEGAVMRTGNRVRITAQLIDARSDTSLWANSFEGEMQDILSLQRDVARAIADGVRRRMPGDDSGEIRQAQVNPAAHLAYLRGRFFWNRWDADSLRRSIECYQEAIGADPSYAQAWAGLADSYSILGNTNAMPPADAYPKARAAAERGLQLDPGLAELHASLGYVHRFFDWDWRAAERRLLRALTLNPGYATARRWYAQFLSGMGRHEEAIAEGERALELDPLSLIIHAAVGDIFYYAREYERSLVYYGKCLEMDPNFGPGNTDIARSLDQLGRSGEALDHFIRGTADASGNAPPSAGLAILLHRTGQAVEATEMIERLVEESAQRFVSPWGLASYFAIAGEPAAALDWLERAYAEKDGTLVWLNVHPRLDSLRHEPRFRDLLRRMQLDA
jgi:eukaryotic-like serine/threonine-protein kinase